MAAVQARIAAIETQFGLRRPPAAITTTSRATFDELLQTQLAGTTTAVERAVGGYPRLEAPAELRVYGNGRIPAVALAATGTNGHLLYPPAARAFDQLMVTARADGIDIGITDSYRDFDAQVRVAEEKGLYSQGGLAAEPGTSPHGWGLAADLDLDERAQAWMRANGARFGFVEDVPREPWHWTYRPA